MHEIRTPAILLDQRPDVGTRTAQRCLLQEPAMDLGPGLSEKFEVLVPRPEPGAVAARFADDEGECRDADHSESMVALTQQRTRRTSTGGLQFVPECIRFRNLRVALWIRE